MIALASPPATDNAPATTDARRITELDADYCRIHAATVKRLTQSVRTLVRGLRRGDQQAVNAFLHRHTQLLREAYVAAHREGQRDYWHSVSLRYAKAPPFVPADETTTRHRLAWYALASVTKLAHEAQNAHRASQVQLHAIAMRPVATVTTDAYRGILLAGGGDDALSEWEASVAPRLDLQAAIGWSGLQDGYLMGGRNDGANPFAFVWWVLDPSVKVHCHDCPLMAMNSPYNQPGSGGNELDRVPGDGRTECGANDKCSLSYRPMGELYDVAAQNVWQSWLGAQNVAALQAGVGADVAAAGGDLVAGAYPELPSPFAIPSIPSIPSIPGIPSILPEQTIRIPNPPEETLTDAQKAALDAFRAAANTWDAVRGELPEAPAFFGDTLTGEGLPEIALMTSEQRVALYRLWDALAMWDEAVSGGGNGQQQFAEGEDGASVRLDNPYPRGPHGHWGEGGMHGQHPSAGGGRGAGAGERGLRAGRSPGGGGGGSVHEAAAHAHRIVQAMHTLEQAKAERDAAQGEADRLRAMPASRRPADQEEAVRTRYGNAHQAMREAATALDVARGGTGVQIDYEERVTGGARQDVHTVFGRDLTAHELIELSGARAGDRIIVRTSRQYDGFDVSVTGSVMRSYTVHTELDGTITLHDHFSRNQGERTTESGQTVIHGIQAAGRLGIDRIECQAARDDAEGLIGYRTWPKLGFDGPIPYHVLDAARSQFGQGITKVSDIREQPAQPGRPSGKAWWNANGTSFNAVFDLHPGSASQQHFAHWLDRLSRHGSQAEE